jgi:hypothetical protein
MPATQLTDDCKAAAARMEQWQLISGHGDTVRQMVYEDSANVEALRLHIQTLADPAAPAGMVDSLVVAHVHASNAMELTGVVALHPLFAADGIALRAAAEFAESWEANPPPGPREIGVTAAIAKDVRPLAMLAEPYRPLDPAMVNLATVRVEGSGWPSLDGQSFTIEVADRPLSQFFLTEADTSAETVGNGIGATIWLEP